ncbi:MAG: outer membrane protein assembly factor BamD [Bacteroidetes bacterium]|nr:outer membrane protein assembly factor BamD [Bacteroidota bacterium]
MKLYLILAVTALSVIFSACGSSDRSNINTDDPEKAYNIAMESYNKKDYLQAIDDFSVIKVKFSGTSISDKAQYYFGMSYLKREEFVLAAYEFEYLLKNYATSSFAIDGRFQLAMCYFGLSPRYSLDQTYTYQAISEFKNFLELYPTDKNAPDAEAKIKELRNKLAFKELKSAELYMKMDDYKAATVYYEHVLDEYFDTDYADDALYGKIITLKTRKKYEEAKKEIERFETRFPKSDLLPKVQNIKKSL